MRSTMSHGKCSNFEAARSNFYLRGNAGVPANETVGDQLCQTGNAVISTRDDQISNNWKILRVPTNEKKKLRGGSAIVGDSSGNEFF